jgi:hypothetical protein
MRKLLELVMIMVFCVSVASGSNIILISDSGFWPSWSETALFPHAGWTSGDVKYNDTAMVEFLMSLGYTVDTSGMAGHYRDVPLAGDTHWTEDAAKIAALNAADLIIMSRFAASGSYDGDRIAWNELTVPILSQSGHLCRGGTTTTVQYWGWCNGNNAAQPKELIMSLAMGHEFVDGFGDPVTLFASEPTTQVRNPVATAVWDAHSSVIGTYAGTPMLVDIPAGTNFDTLCGTTNVFGIAGARRAYFGHWGYDANATYSWDQIITNDYKNLFAQAVARAMSPVKVVNDLPANGAALIPVDPAASENDLVFTVLDSNVTAVDVYLGPDNEPNLTSKPQYRIVNDLSVTPGQNTIDLVGELTGNLSNGTDYYWRVIGLEPNAVTSILEPVGTGQVWKFTTQAAVPVISAVLPAKIAAFIGDPNVIFTVTTENVETYQWYKDADSTVGGGTALSNGADYSGVDTDTLIINDIAAGDFMYYYCVGSKAGFTSVTSTPYGLLEMKGLKHHFPFESAASGKTLDIISGVVEAELIGGASLASTDSIVGNYLQLDNAGATASDTQYASILNGSSVADHKEITISAWIRQDTRDIGCVFDLGENQNNYFTFTTGYKEGVAKTEFTYQVAGVGKQGENEVDFDRTGDWQFVTVTLDSEGRSKTYIDGQFKGSGDLRGDDVSEINLTDITKTYNYIGNRIYPNLPKFDGLIDELKIYNYIRTTQEIAQDYMDVRTDVTYVCNSEEDDLSVWDLDGNCRIDISDLAELVSKWLEHDRIYRP